MGGILAVWQYFARIRQPVKSSHARKVEK